MYTIYKETPWFLYYLQNKDIDIDIALYQKSENGQATLRFGDESPAFKKRHF